MTRHDQAHGGLPERLGYSILAVTRERAVARLTITPAVLQVAGVVHGGALFALADSVAASLAMSLHPEASGATLDAAIRFFRPVKAGAVTATARVLHHGRRTLALEVRLVDQGKRLAALFTTIYLLGGGRPARSGRPR